MSRYHLLAQNAIPKWTLFGGWYDEMPSDPAQASSQLHLVTAFVCLFTTLNIVRILHLYIHHQVSVIRSALGQIDEEKPTQELIPTCAGSTQDFRQNLCDIPPPGVFPGGEHPGFASVRART